MQARERLVVSSGSKRLEHADKKGQWEACKVEDKGNLNNGVYALHQSKVVKLKPGRISTVLAAVAILSACAYLPPADAPVRRVSPDYSASGDVMDASAYLYGKRTVLEFEHAPAFLIVKDENGASVDYERVGRHYRLARKLDQFTAWINGRAVTFSFVEREPVKPSAPIAAPVAAPVQVLQQTIPARSPADADLSALLKVADQQLKEVRRILEAAGENPHATGDQLYVAKARLDEIQARLIAASSAVIRVGFPTGSTQFKPSPDVAKVLINAAKIAEQINIRGRTDALVAGPADPKIAWGRTMAARKFLVDNGVDPDKIKATSQADGDFVAPNLTRSGKAMNRRVEVEIVHSRIAYLQDKTVQVAGR